VSPIVQDETISADLLIRSLRRNGVRPALNSDGRVWSAAALADEISRWAQAYQAWSIGVGSHTAILAANRPEVLFQIATNMVTGARTTALHPMGSLADQAHILRDAGVQTLFYDPDHYEQRAAELKEQVPGLKHVLALAPGAEFPDVPTAAARFGPRALRRPDIRPDDVFQIAYTGGTTGRPKGVVQSVRAQAAQTQVLLTEWDWPRELRYLCATPLSHSGRVSFLPTLVRGGELVLTSGFDPERFADAIQRHRITTTLLVPTMIYRLLDQDLSRYDLSSLHRLYYGASAMSPTRLREGIERLGSVFFQFYGQAECPMTVAVLPPEEHLIDDPGRLASCGRPIPWLDTALLDEDGHEVPTGEPGEICVRGPLVMRGYHNDPDQTAQAFRGGWLHTGDVARADDQGYLTIVDRTKDIIISGGFNVYPREVEDVLTGHAEVSAAAVIGVPDPDWGESVKAVVVRRSSAGVSAGELISLVRERKGAVYAPKSVDFVDSIPLTGVGKPDKKALRAAYWPAEGRQVN
jgi:fatty-acyl-CoA synthase